jgi:hypothetical protein
MYAQVDFEVIYKISKKEGRPSNFCKFWSKEVHYRKDLQKKNFDV